MLVIFANNIGRVHHGAGHQDLSKTRPIYAYIPEEYFDGNGFKRTAYMMSRWPSINCAANPLGIGSHVFPDPARPVSIRSRCPILSEFLAQLAVIAPTKAAA